MTRCLVIAVICIFDTVTVVFDAKTDSIDARVIAQRGWVLRVTHWNNSK